LSEFASRSSAAFGVNLGSFALPSCVVVPANMSDSMNLQTKAILTAFAIAAVLGFVLLGILILHGMSTAFGPNPKCKYDYGVNVYSPDRSYVVEVEDYVCRPWRLKTLSKRVVIVALPATDLHRPPPGEIFEIKGDHPVKAFANTS